jgi:hypothetical protein
MHGKTHGHLHGHRQTDGFTHEGGESVRNVTETTLHTHRHSHTNRQTDTDTHTHNFIALNANRRSGKKIVTR